jgi:hypothetical protein
MQTAFSVTVDFWVRGTPRKSHLTFHLINDEGIVVLTSGSPIAVREPGLHRAVCHFPANLLNSGGYSVKLLIVENGNQVTHVRDSAITFSLADAGERGEGWLGREPGVVQPPLRWETLPPGDIQETPSMNTVTTQ